MTKRFDLTVIILTYNSEESILKVLNAVRQLDARILVVDSFSTDSTVELAHSVGAEIVKHPFENYASQRNWAQQYANLSPNSWVLHLDADEIVDELLLRNIREELCSSQVDGYLVKRLTYFLGKRICFGNSGYSWHLRLFRSGKGKCENRLYDQHFIANGNIKKLDGCIHDLQLISIDRWTTAHNKWATSEACEILTARHTLLMQKSDSTLQASLTGDLRSRKRWLKNNIYYRLPLFIRPFLFFVYSYFLKLGILDGRVGFIYHLLHDFWFRFLVDAKIWEVERKMREEGIDCAVAMRKVLGISA